MRDDTVGGSGWARLGRAVLIFVAAVAAAWFANLAYAAFLFLAGDATGLAEEEVDWSTQPLEIFADGTEACVLNVEGVAPGRHEVAPFASGPAAQVVIKDPRGEVIFRATAQPSRKPVHPRAVELRAFGRHRVECRSEGVVTSAPLDVTRASDLDSE